MDGIGELAALFTGNARAVDGVEGKTAATAEPASGATAAARPASAGVDRTTVSEAGGGLQAALAGDDVRTGLVERLRASIADGSYNVPSSAVADKLIAHLNGGGY